MIVHSPRLMKGLREDEDLIIHMHVLGLPSIAVNNSSAPGQGVAHATQCFTEANATSYRGNQFIWDKLRQCSARMRQSRTTYRSRGRFDMLTDLREIATIDHAPGHIQKIVQYEGLIAVASTVSDGMWGNSNRPLDHYNSGGALKVSMKGALHTLPAHMQRRKLRGREEVQHYSLNDIQFNTTVPGRLVSVGTDRKLQVWDCLGLQDNQELCPVRTVTYNCVMSAVLFKPREALLAMAVWDGNVYLYADAMSAPTKNRLRVAPVSNQEISGLSWGRDALSSMLFASTMTRYEQDFLGYHRAYDATTRQIVCEYKIDEAGEQLAVEESDRWYKTHHLDKAVQTRTQPMVVRCAYSRHAAHC